MVGPAPRHGAQSFDRTRSHRVACRGDRRPGRRCRSRDYRRLAAFIEASFVETGGHPLIIAGAHYGANDAFFEARGHYSLFETCNEWTRRGLAAAGVRVPVWAPFDKALFYQLPSG